MPIMNIRYPSGSLDKAGKQVVAASLNEALITMEGGAGTYGGQAFAWVRSYFDAKGRQYAAAGYPPDAAGLLPSGAARS